MATRVLILTEPDDDHAPIVAEAVRRKGGEPILWQTSDFPSRSRESFRFDGDDKRVLVRGPDLELRDPAPHVVWHRRPAMACDLDRLHPADREYAAGECREFRRSGLLTLAPSAFWINPREAAERANFKLLQHQIAGEIGLAMPATLYSNDPEQIRDFIAEQGGAVVYKPLKSTPAMWSVGGANVVLYTARVTASDVEDDETVSAVPAIYQQLVPKAYELRVTVMGRHVMAARLLSQETRRGQLDFRRAYDELRAEPSDLPGDLVAAIHAFMARMRLVFGCIDILVTPDGRHLFLEVNEMGQFLFVENLAGIPLLDAFAEFLVQARPDFQWTPGPACLTAEALRGPAERVAHEIRRQHVRRRQRAYVDQPTITQEQS